MPQSSMSAWYLERRIRGWLGAKGNMAVSVLGLSGEAAFEFLTNVALVGLMAGTVYADLRLRRIPNRLTIGVAAVGLLLNLLFGGLDGAVSSVEGWLLGVGLLFAFFALGAMGAGDVKLLAAAGALRGPSFVFNAFVFTGIAGGVIAIVVVLRRRRVRYAVASVALQIQSLVYTGGLPRPKDLKSSPLSFPYSLAIATGSVAALFVRL